MLRTTVARTIACKRVSSLNIARTVSTKGPLKAEVTQDAHPTHKDKDEDVLEMARKVAADVKNDARDPNKEVVWSASQNPRQAAMTGPRFEQTDFSLQPRPQPAIELIAKQPIRMETSRVVSCNGGGGALGHPKVYINLDKAGEPNVCPYCGIRFQMQAHRAEKLEAVGGN